MKWIFMYSMRINMNHGWNKNRLNRYIDRFVFNSPRKFKTGWDLIVVDEWRGYLLRTKQSHPASHPSPQRLHTSTRTPLEELQIDKLICRPILSLLTELHGQEQLTLVADQLILRTSQLESQHRDTSHTHQLPCVQFWRENKLTENSGKFRTGHPGRSTTGQEWAGGECKSRDFPSPSDWKWWTQFTAKLAHRGSCWSIYNRYARGGITEQRWESGKYGYAR